MESFHFACPYCSGQFEVQHRLPGHAMACPHCGGTVALPADVPPPVAGEAPADHSPADGAPPPDPPSVEPTTSSIGEGQSADPLAPPHEIELFQPPTITVDGSQSPGARPTALAEVRQLTRAERERRRAVRNLVLMGVGVIVLVVAVLVLSRV